LADASRGRRIIGDCRPCRGRSTRSEMARIDKGC
jgi:hypothetical protein